VMTHLALISQYGARMLIAIAVSTLAGMAVTAWVLRAALGPSDPPPGSGSAPSNVV